jgi:hypothetical protein
MTEANTVTPPAKPAEPSTALLMMCVECGDGMQMPLPLDMRRLSFFLAQNAWFPSVVSPPNQGAEAPMVIAPLCAACAKKVYPAEMFKVIEERRLSLLKAAQEALVKQGPQGPR